MHVARLDRARAARVVTRSVDWIFDLLSRRTDWVLLIIAQYTNTAARESRVEFSFVLHKDNLKMQNRKLCAVVLESRRVRGRLAAPFFVKFTQKFVGRDFVLMNSVTLGGVFE